MLPHQRLSEAHPEVVAKTDNLQFPGPGQRDTPVARTKEDAYYRYRLLGAANQYLRLCRLALGLGCRHRAELAITELQATSGTGGGDCLF